MRRNPALLAFLLLFAASLPAGAEESAPRAERWLHNARLQTERGLASLESGSLDDAVERFDSARRLEDQNPVTSFNAATAKLVAGRPEAVAELLQLAAVAPPELAAAANYNLGNAQLVAGDPAAAIDSFKNALRLEPNLEDAKFNLELAQRLLEEQQQQQQQEQQQDGEQSDQPDQQEAPQGGEDRPQEEEQEEQEEQQQEGDQESQQQPEPQDQDEEQQRESPLPDFEEQQDMTAEQAAAILEAIENLERDQRRRQAEERARRRAREGKDW